jgi:prepilin-type N-terminal cleavage/methylation domain-containing protein
MPRKAAQACSLGSQAGFTLVELLIAVVVLIVVLLSTASVLNLTSRVAVREQARAFAIGNARVGLARMTRELRQAQQVFSTGDASMDVEVVIAGQPTRVLYRCDWQPAGTTYRQCIRAASTDLSQPPDASAGQLVLDRVLNGSSDDPSDPVFTFTPDGTDPTYVEAKVVVPAKGTGSGYSHNLVLDDGFYMRNLAAQ